jgi:predicted phosphodiesterase
VRVIKRDIEVSSRSDTFRLYPFGDIHDGAAACDLDSLRALVKEIEADDNAYWLGMGDYCDYINRSDPRFNVSALAPWINMEHLGDLAKAQSRHILAILKPIASKCLGLLEGNHESAVHKHYERDVYSEIVTGIKDAGGFPPETQLAFGYSGWLNLHFIRRSSRGNRMSSNIRIALHHGFVGGKLAGAKALNMQRFLWNHECDLAIFGHSHNTGIQAEQVEGLNVRTNKIEYSVRWGAYAGSFLKTNVDGVTTYSEVKGYFPLPVAGIVVHFAPFKGNDSAPNVANERLKIVTR